MATPEIKGIDNRGGKEVPFGWVYVDDTRVLFGQDQGDPVLAGAKPEGYWKYPTPEQFEAVKAHLDEELPNWRRV